MAGVVVGFLVVALVVFIGVKVFGGGDDKPPVAAATTSSAAPHATSRLPDIPVPNVPQSVLDTLPVAETEGKVPKAPIDLTSASGGLAIRVDKAMPGFAKPGADPVTMIPKSQIGSTTWLPVLRTERGWAQVRLPARPNGATVWIPEAGLNRAKTKWAVQVSLSKGTLTITYDGKSRGTWDVGQGKATTPTPVGQTFLLSGFVDPNQSFSPVIYALGAHSDTLDSYGGGPGTVAVHGWPTKQGREGKVSHGCIRVPAAALKMFAKLPTGTPVDITA
ncbi:L,D-transpeptidase [Flexivirga alba]|uniref:L,D-transpeptidase n=1 Tax=Flexivirga alba TaxID=702742 RepID=A0ABW2ADQ8_9MICO